jgi:hypothetical protein
MSLKRLALYLGVAFLIVFIVQSPSEAAKVVKAAGESASEWFSVASSAFAKFLKSLV